MKKRFAFFITLILPLLLTAPLSSQHISTFTTITLDEARNLQSSYFLSGNETIIRREPSLRSAAVSTVKDYHEVQVLAITSIYEMRGTSLAPWIKIRFGTTEGFAYGADVGKSLVANKDTKPYLGSFDLFLSDQKSVKGIVLQNGTRLYQYPDKALAPIMTVDAGRLIDVISPVQAYYIPEVQEYWYRVSVNGNQGYMTGDQIATDVFSRGNYIYGIHKKPDRVVAMVCCFPIIDESEIVVFDAAERKIVQKFHTPEKSDTLSFVSDSQFNNIFDKPFIQVQSTSKNFSTWTRGYTANHIYFINNNGMLERMVFSWYLKLSYDDRPSVHLKSLIVSTNSITMQYSFFESYSVFLGSKGELTITYSIKDNHVTFKNLSSTVVQSRKMEGNAVVELPNPVPIQFTRDSLNEKMRYLAKDPEFIFSE